MNDFDVDKRLPLVIAIKSEENLLLHTTKSLCQLLHTTQFLVYQSESQGSC
jgi:hypothetical protein